MVSAFCALAWTQRSSGCGEGKIQVQRVRRRRMVRASGRDFKGLGFLSLARLRELQHRAVVWTYGRAFGLLRCEFEDSEQTRDASVQLHGFLGCSVPALGRRSEEH